jgi:predicted ATPase/class 3 adenylate cyclase/DNA-binding XRE family transcriptional regulator
LAEVSFGEWLKRRRKAQGLTQEALAQQINCSTSALRKIEAEERRPSEQIVEQLADLFNISSGERASFLKYARGNWEAAPTGVREDAPWRVSYPPEYKDPLNPRIHLATFLFTDIEDSSKLWESAPEQMKLALQRHHAILQNVIASNGGNVFQIVGDAFCAAFPTAPSAISAAVIAQRSLHEEQWDLPFPIRVRMGIHTGEAEPMSADSSIGGYASNQTLNRVARILKAAHGGQILVSLVTKELLRDSLPANTELRDKGKHYLKNLMRPEHLFELNVEGLPSDFPPLNTLSTLPNNLPAQLTSFIGRVRELAEVKQLLTRTHLLTVTGPGGTGKTRLSLQLAAELLDAQQFTDGVWLVELAPLADPTLVTQTVASTLGVREQPGRIILDALLDYLRGKSLLLILDNCEHLIEACAQLANALLRAAPHLKILASSREALDIAGETAYLLPSLPLPDLQGASLDALAQNDCVRLFVDRALAAYPPFRLKEKNAPAIAEICLQLDGIPLAIELAAARAKVFPPKQIAARLDDRFRLLTGGSRAALPRHQTLRALIDWSYDLLSEAERTLLRRLSIFAGGWSFEAVQAVCGEGIDTEGLDLLMQLVNKSLVAVEEEPDEGRYHLLETIRQYALDKLFESGEAQQVQDRHLEFFLHFAEAAEPKLRSAEQLAWLERVEIEHDDLRSALAWSLEGDSSERAQRLTGALFYFWELRGYWSEGQKWLDAALALSAQEPRERVVAGLNSILSREEMFQRAKALNGAARLRLAAFAELHTAWTLAAESLDLWRALDDKWWTATTLETIGVACIFRGDHQTARSRLEEGIALARQLEDQWPLAFCLTRLGNALVRLDTNMARPLLEEAVVVSRAVGDKAILSFALVGLCGIYYFQGQAVAAAALAEEALTAARAVGRSLYLYLSLLLVGGTALAQGDIAKARAYGLQLVALAQETGQVTPALFAILGFGGLASSIRQPKRAVHLLAAFESLLHRYGVNLSAWGGPFEMAQKQFMQMAQAQLDPVAFEAALQEGHALKLEQALALVAENESEDSQLSGAGLGPRST